MLLKDLRVIRPKTTKIQTKNGIKHVYQVVAKEYKKDKKYTVEKRVMIGKMIDDEYMIPNERFEEFYPNEICVEKAAPEFSDTLKIGNHIVIDTIMNEYKINELLDSVFENQANVIKDLIMFMIISESSTIQHFESFMYDHLSFEKKIRSDSYVSRMLNNDIDDEMIRLFIDAWNRLNSDVKDVYVCCDGTNMNTTAKGIELAEFGYAKDDDSKPQVNLSYIINQSNSLPLSYDLYDGSIIDNSTGRYLIEKMKEYGYENVGFISDRGYFSKQNIDDLINNGYEYIIMVKDSNKFVKKAISEVGAMLRKLNKYYIAEHRVYGITLKDKLFQSDKQESYIHIYYDNIRAEQTRNDWLERLRKVEKEIQKKVEEKIVTKEKMATCEKFFRFKYDEYGYLLSYERKEEKIQEYTDQLGYFTIVTSKEMTAERALDIYRDRDCVEKMFRSIKSQLGYNKFGVHKEDGLKAKTLLVFIASIVRSVMGQKFEILLSDDKKHYTIPACIRELEKVEMSKNSLGKYTRKYALTAKQKAILRAVGIDEKTIDEYVKKNRG